MIGIFPKRLPSAFREQPFYIASYLIKALFIDDIVFTEKGAKL